MKARREKFAPRSADKEKSTCGVHVLSQSRKQDTELIFSADWNLKLKGTLDGQARIRRLSGDLIVPGEPSFPLGLRALTLDLNEIGRASCRERVCQYV